MAKVLVDGCWYEDISAGGMYETDYERILLTQAPLIYPEFHAVEFKCMVYTESESAKPDLALIDKSYRGWWVVEVELGTHSLHAHVLPQVRTLALARYGESEVSYMVAMNPQLDRDRMSDLMKGHQPSVLVVVNTPRPEWRRELAPYGALLAVFEVFRSDRNRHAFRINGDRPSISVDVVSRCFLDPMLTRMLVVESPAALGVPPHSKVQLLYGGSATEWQRVDARDKVWLVPTGRNPLSAREAYNLVRLADGSLEIRSIRT